ncbi:serine/threonine-protein kinase [Actinoalloteichus fjordicus]|uniref:Protein kinase family protein n=1 Tax=Actinoalloteichus fjordicus TaxID=1612552 RepID=A0AAC9LDG1_9PSEU|nr:bifunctional serine/threonine protein kinase/MFS transporter [Actinoalloteichus fjordicus]APU15823.1 protein kinase family protein [Actinoalloteichus fjordicus]
MRPLRASEPQETGGYRLLAELGRGGMGRVLLGGGPDGRLVAIKQIHPHLVEEDGFRARFEREVRVTRAVHGVYTATVIDADAQAPTPWLASEFIFGPSLREAVEATGRLPAESLPRLAAGLAAALVRIHEAGLVHRDLKPSNILLADEGPRLIDFGIARALDRRDGRDLTRTGLVVGSPEFMSPEQAQAGAITPASDMFSLGAVLVMAGTGTSLFAGPSDFQVLYDIVYAEADLDAVPVGIRPIVAACLAKDPAARPDAARLLEMIGRIAPYARPWPAEVHALTMTQHAAVERLVERPSDCAAEPAGATRVEAPQSTPYRTRLQVHRLDEWDANAGQAAAGQVDGAQPGTAQAGAEQPPRPSRWSGLRTRARHALTSTGGRLRTGLRGPGLRRIGATASLLILVFAGVLVGVYAANFAVDTTVLTGDGGDGGDREVRRFLGPAEWLVDSASVFGTLAGAVIGVLVCTLISAVGGRATEPRTAFLRRCLLVGAPVGGFVLGRLAERDGLRIDILGVGTGIADIEPAIAVGCVLGLTIGSAAVSVVLGTFPVPKDRHGTVTVVVWVLGALTGFLVGLLSSRYGWLGIVIDGGVTLDAVAVLGGCIGGSWALRAADQWQTRRAARPGRVRV